MTLVVPAPRLLAWTAGLLVPLLALAVALPASGTLGLPVAGAAAALALLDAVGSRRRLARVRAQVPAVSRVTAGRSVPLPVELSGIGHLATLRLAIDCPEAVVPDPDVLTVALPAASDEATCSWSLIGQRRGLFRLERCHVEATSRLGLFQVRTTLPLAGEVRIYPDLAPARRQVAVELLRREGVGGHRSRPVGKGREVDQLRPYQPGDSREDVHWRATARRGEPITKVYRLEQTQEVVAVLDAGRLSRQPLRDRRLLDAYLEAALVLAQVTAGEGDRFGLVVHGERVEHFVPAAGGREQIARCREALLTVEPESASTDFGELAAFALARLRRRALIVFLTDLSEPVLAEGFLAAAALLARRHLLVVAQFPPAGARPLFAEGLPPGSAAIDLAERLAGHLLWQRAETHRRALSRLGVASLWLSRESPVADLVAHYLTVKARQLL